MAIVRAPWQRASSSGSITPVVDPECEKPIEDGRVVVERVDDPWDEDERPELGWFCEACAAREGFVGNRS